MRSAWRNFSGWTGLKKGIKWYTMRPINEKSAQSTRSSYIPLYCPFLDEGSISIFNILSKWRKRKTCFFFFQKEGLLQARSCLKKREERCLRSDKAGEGLGEGEASPSPPRREIFEISLPSNGVTLHLRLNSIAFCLNTIHYSKTLFWTP